MKKLFLFLIGLSLICFACKKEEPVDYSAEELIEQGLTIEELLEEKPVGALIGLEYQGGILFHIDTTLKTGLVVSKTDISETAWWGCNGQSIGVGSHDFGQGDSNTNQIVSLCNDAASAAALCYYSYLENYQDWYLPSEDEMELIYSTLKPLNVGDFEDDFYWTSTEHNQFYAQYLLFLDGSVGFKAKSDPHRVRAIRDVQ